MQITDRKENPLLDRVEIEFVITHDGDPTPSRAAIIAAVAQSEPGADREMIVVKGVNTRFGQSLTNGKAYIYGSKESMTVEAKYIHARHSSGEKEEAKPTPAPVAEQSDDDGGEE